jgi:hypothetical protein
VELRASTVARKIAYTREQFIKVIQIEIDRGHTQTTEFFKAVGKHFDLSAGGAQSRAKLWELSEYIPKFESARGKHLRKENYVAKPKLEPAPAPAQPNDDTSLNDIDILIDCFEQCGVKLTSIADTLTFGEQYDSEHNIKIRRAWSMFRRRVGMPAPHAPYREFLQEYYSKTRDE